MCPYIHFHFFLNRSSIILFIGVLLLIVYPLLSLRHFVYLLFKIIYYSILIMYLFSHIYIFQFNSISSFSYTFIFFAKFVDLFLNLVSPLWSFISSEICSIFLNALSNSSLLITFLIWGLSFFLLFAKSDISHILTSSSFFGQIFTVFNTICASKFKTQHFA